MNRGLHDVGLWLNPIPGPGLFASFCARGLNSSGLSWPCSSLALHVVATWRRVERVFFLLP